MDFLKLPPEIMETIFLKLDPQALAACALADRRLVKVLYSGHFLDAYCRKTLSCPWITAQDINELEIAVPFRFWFLVYSTFKMEETQGKLFIHNTTLTKIGTFKDMFIMWLVCGHRPSYLDSYTLMNVLYPLPETVDEVFTSNSRPEPIVLDTLLKVFFSFPEIMHISCTPLKLFQMQSCSPAINMSLYRVFEQSIKSNLPQKFTPLHSVEIMSASCTSCHPTIIILIARECWVLWLGTVSTSSEETSVLSKIFLQWFDHSLPPSRIRERCKSSMCKLSYQVQNERGYPALSGILSQIPECLYPIISGEDSDIAGLVISLAQENNRSLQRKFLSVYKAGCQEIVDATQNLSEDEKKAIVKHFMYRANSRNQIDDYIMKVLQADVTSVRTCSKYHLPYAIYKSILERLACIFRNENYFYVAHSFSHCFLCGCIGPTLPVKTSSSMETKIEKCVTANMNDGIFSPLMWPPHVLSLACQIVPALVYVFQTDLHFLRHGGQKCAVPDSIVDLLARDLYLYGLAFTHRPPNKTRCPPLLNQVRLIIQDVMEI